MDEIKGILPASPVSKNLPGISIEPGQAREQTLLRNRLERIYALTSDLMCIVGFDGYFKDINPAFEKLLGFTREELLSKPFIEFVDADDRKATLAVVAGLTEGKEATGFENRYRCLDGSLKWLFWNANSDPDEGLIYAVAHDLTERKRVEEKISDLAKFPGENPNPIARINLDGVIIYANEACNPLLKYWGCRVGETLPGDFRRFVQSVSEEGNIHEQEIAIGDQTFLISWVPVAGTSYVNVYGRNITERKQAEDALRESQSLLNETQKITKVGGWQYDVASQRVTWTDEVYNIYGVTKDYDPSSPEQDMHFYATEDQQQINEAFQRAVERGDPYDLELQLDNANGERLWVRTIGQVERKGDEVVRLFGNILDITERKRAEDALGRYAHRMGVINRLDHVISSNLDIGQVYDAFVIELKDLVEFDRTSIVLLDDAGENWQVFRQWTRGKPAFQPSVWYPLKGSAPGWVFQNRRAYLESRLGEKGEWPEHKTLRAEGLQCRVLFPLIIQDQVIGLLTFASRQAEAYPASDVELLQTLADQLAIAVQNSRLYEQARLTAEDLERRVQARTAQLEKANKDLESFSYSVSHDLRAPLRAINGFAQILARRHRADLDEEGQHYLDNVVEASTRMGILIDDLLQYSRIGRASVRRQTVRLEELFAQILGDLASRITETHGEIHLPPPGSMPSIQSDATILGQVFTNIIDNALTYYRPGIPPVIRVTYQAEVDHYLFGFADNGIGIPAEYLEKIFNVFQRLHTSEEYPGTGIGLAIVKKSAELLNGRVWAESTEDAGSTFWIQIPRE